MSKLDDIIFLNMSSVLFRDLIASLSQLLYKFGYIWIVLLNLLVDCCLQIT